MGSVASAVGRAPINPGRVRLKRTLNRRVGDKEYYKWVIADVPPDTVQELGWTEGEELEGSVDAHGLTIHPPRRKRKLES